MPTKIDRPIWNLYSGANDTEFTLTTPTRNVLVSVKPDGTLTIEVQTENQGEQGLRFTYKADIKPVETVPQDSEAVASANKGVLGMWRVPSDSHMGQSYIVALWKSGSWTCDCPNFVNRRPIGGCKHIQRKADSPLGVYLVSTLR